MSDTRKVVINACFGGFSLSEAANERLVAAGVAKWYDWELHVASWGRPCDSRDIARDNAELIRVVEEMGTDADGECARLEIVEIPADVTWEIDEYDGFEHVAETHRTWR